MPSAPVIDRPAADVAAEVTVTVQGDETIVCSPDPISVKAGQHVVEFQLATPGYVFRRHDAIVVSNPGRDFPRPSVTSPCGTKATLRDRDLDREEYKYTVYLVQVATGRIISVDPVIRNEA
ncbi:MAG: hypothetical protein HZC37_19040 [Burkholderiales bacterium]|nr:hypothetical protein [Burkholderiales bacterium]